MTIGIDVESREAIGPDVLGVAETVCSPAEMEQLRALPEEERADHFLRLWTMKEAMAKAAGGTWDDTGSWWLATWQLDETHRVAVAIKNPVA